MADPVSKSQARDIQSGAVASALTPSEQTVRFINSEVLDPPGQGGISFVKPFAEQVAVMALEDGRSFLQGLEQVLLVAIAKALEKLLGGTDKAAAPAAASAPAAAAATDPGALAAVNQALQAAERMLLALPQFHASLADAVLKVRTPSGQAPSPSPPV